MQGCQKKIHIAADLENLIIMPNGIRELGRLKWFWTWNKDINREYCCIQLYIFQLIDLYCHLIDGTTRHKAKLKFWLFLDYSSDMTLGFFISYIYLSFSFDKKIKLRLALRIPPLLEFNNEFRQLSAFDIKKILNEPFDNSKIRKSFIMIHFYDGFRVN